jgi:hypothetical protein
MALAANRVIRDKHSPEVERYGVAAGAIRIYQGALVNLNTSGYAKLGADAANEKFLGIAVDELNQAAGGSNGDNNVEVITAKSGKIVELPTASAITVANIGDEVCVDGDDNVDLTANVTNNVRVGTIKSIAGANLAWVQLD